MLLVGEASAKSADRDLDLPPRRSSSEEDALHTDSRISLFSLPRFPLS